MKSVLTTLATALLLIAPAWAGYPQCAGSTEPVKCNQLHADLAAETPTQREERIKRFKAEKKATDAAVTAQPNYKHQQSTLKPSIGMTRAEAIDSAWGRPKDINTTTTASAVREQWVYGLSRYLYFVNGILTTIQE